MIHCVEARAAHEDVLDAQASQNLNGHRVDVCVYKSAHRVVSLGHDGGTPREVGLREGNVYLGEILELALKRLTVIAGGAKKEEFHVCPSVRAQPKPRPECRCFYGSAA